VITKINFSITNGYTHNQIPIPSNCPSGIYTMAAFDIESGQVFFSKLISIVTRKKLKVTPIHTPTQFAFEGGGFTLNAKNRLVVRTSPNSSINLITPSITVATTRSDSLGFASLEFVPEKTDTYSLAINGEAIALPTPTDQVCGLHFIEVAEQKRIEVRLPENTKSYKEVFLLLINNQKIIASSAVLPSNDGTFIYTIDSRDLPNGVTQAVVVNEASVLAERHFFNYQPKVVVKLQLDNPIPSQRNHLTTTVSLKDNAGNPLQGNFTLTVSPFSTSQGLVPLTIEEEFFINPALAGLNNKLPEDVVSRQKLINEILILNPSHSLPWKQILSNKIVRKPSSDKLVLKARLTLEKSGTKVADSTIINCFLQNSMIGYEATVNNNLMLEVPFLYDFYGKEEIFYSVDEELINRVGAYKLEVDTCKTAPKNYLQAEELNIDDEYGELAFKIGLVAESYGFFQNKIAQQKPILNLNEKFEKEAMGVDISVNVDDYVVFPTMQDLVKEVIPFLEVRKRREKLNTRLLIKQKTYFSRAKYGPLFVIDGALTKDESLFLDLKPVEVFRIKIINDANRLTKFGSLGRNGIVLIETKKKSSAKLKDTSKTISFLGLNKPVKENLSQSITPQKMPDLRTNLLWIPMAETTALGQATMDFHTSDLKGSFIIRVRGKTKNGNPFEAEQLFEIK
jgi:hypothetical protein